MSGCGLELISELRGSRRQALGSGLGSKRGLQHGDAGVPGNQGGIPESLHIILADIREVFREPNGRSQGLGALLRVRIGHEQKQVEVHLALDHIREPNGFRRVTRRESRSQMNRQRPKRPTIAHGPSKGPTSLVAPGLHPDADCDAAIGGSDATNRGEKLPGLPTRNVEVMILHLSLGIFHDWVGSPMTHNNLFLVMEVLLPILLSH